ncbi:MAG: hypothetical protein GY810_26000 [Aureispira sp.]|nr:hypothetical protein [Aureispira sp.]
MNILDDLNFTTAKPAVLKLKQNESVNILTVGLIEKQLLTKHKTKWPTTLVVLQGAIIFKIEGEEINLKKFDVFDIPVNVEHEVEGQDERNVFMLTQEKR